MTQLGPNVGFTPIPLQNGLDTIFGALIVVPVATPGSSSQPYLFKLTPGQFSPKVAIADFRYPNDNVSSSMQIDGSFSSKVGATVPLYGSLSLDSSSSSVYKVNYTLSNFGMVEKPEPSNWTYSTGIQNLSAADKTRLYDALRNNPGSTLLYVNKIYVVQQVTFGVSQASKLAVDAKLDVGSVVTATGAYSFSNSSEKTTSFTETIVNIGGIAIQLDVASVSATNTVSTHSIADTAASMSDAIKAGSARLLPSKFTTASKGLIKSLKFE